MKVFQNSTLFTRCYVNYDLLRLHMFLLEGGFVRTIQGYVPHLYSLSCTGNTHSCYSHPVEPPLLYIALEFKYKTLERREGCQNTVKVGRCSASLKHNVCSHNLY